MRWKNAQTKQYEANTSKKYFGVYYIAYLPLGMGPLSMICVLGDTAWKKIIFPFWVVVNYR